MVPQNAGDDNVDFSFESIRGMDAPRRRKRADRLALGVQKLMEDTGRSWQQLPWPVQFLPTLVEFLPEWGKLVAVNPGLGGLGGLMGLEKHTINQRLNEKFRPRSLFFETLPSDREELEKIFTGEHGSPPRWPAILKPDVGERATDVTFLRMEQVDEFLKKNDARSWLFEEFADTRSEFGLSWTIDPATDLMRIRSVVEKKIPFVTGDGKRSLQALIDEMVDSKNLAKDRRTKILNGFSTEQLTEILPIGEEWTVVRTASISFGTEFVEVEVSSDDEQLVALVRNLITDFDGLFAGRFDLRSENFSELQSGNTAVVELNGIGGMPLEIYQQKLLVSEKYELLRDYFQWLLQIAQLNVDNGNGKSIPLFLGTREILPLLFGPNRTQTLPPGVMRDLRTVFKNVTQGRMRASAVGKFLNNIFSQRSD